MTCVLKQAIGNSAILRVLQQNFSCNEACHVNAVLPTTCSTGLVLRAPVSSAMASWMVFEHDAGARAPLFTTSLLAILEDR
jgi:hypothetical protein